MSVIQRLAAFSKKLGTARVKEGKTLSQTLNPQTRKVPAMHGQGSTGNIIAALCSFFIPGLGQLLQGRLLMAATQFVLSILLWIVWLGWAVHLWSILDAALYQPRYARYS
jgi:TM2 domain-containing membrane protein YozV